MAKIANAIFLYSVGTYIYSIKPDREETDEVGISIGSNAKRDVKIQTNPIILTFSDDERLTGSENYYIGIKEIGGKDWQFVNVYSSTNPQINSNGPKVAFEYKLYKDNVYVALFAYFNKNTKIKDKPKVLSMVASMPDNIIEILDGRYNEDAVIKLNAKEIIASAVTVLGVDENNITRNWVNGSLVIGFVNNLTTNTDYTISIGDIEADIDKLAFKLFEPLTFTTTGDSYVSITPDDGNAFI